MNNLLFLLFLLFSSLTFGQEYEEGEEPALYSFYAGETAYILADSVHVRSAASAAAASLTRLPIGTKVIIRDVSETNTRLNGVLMPWYKVEYAKGKRGYIWGGKLAQTSFRSNGDHAYAFHFGVDKMVDWETFFQIRVEKDGKEVQRISFSGFGHKSHSLTNKGNRGIPNIDDVIYIDANGEFCGDYGGAIVFFWSEGKLTLVQKLYHVGDGPFFTSDYFIFPADMEGEKGKIILHKEEGEYVDDEEDPSDMKVVYSKKLDTRFRWDGEQLVKVK